MTSESIEVNPYNSGLERNDPSREHMVDFRLMKVGPGNHVGTSLAMLIHLSKQVWFKLTL